MGAFFARNPDKQFGSFHFELALVESSASDAAVQLMHNPRKVVASLTSKDDMVVLAHEAVSIFHEWKHLHDCYGTFSGISLVGAWFELLKEFSMLAMSLKQSGSTWRLPPKDWAKSADCPKEVRAFVRRARAFFRTSELFIANFAAISVEGHLEEALSSIPHEYGFEIDAYAQRYAVYHPSTKKRVDRTALRPIGFEALIEGNAHAIARTFVDNFFPEEVSEALAPRMEILDSSESDQTAGSLTSEARLPYNSCDLYISKLLRKRGIDHFPRSLCLIVTDIALSHASIDLIETEDGLTRAQADRFGGLLESILKSASDEQLRDASMPHSQFVDERYQKYLAWLEAGKSWETVHDDRSPIASVRIWESYVAQELTVPLLRHRLANNHAGYRSVDGALEMIRDVPHVPARVLNGAIQFDTPPRVQEAWWHVLMLTQYLRQLFSEGTTLFCPRADRRIPGIDGVNLAFTGHCDVHERFGCGSWAAAMYNYTPRCLFNDGLRRCAIDSKK